MAKTNNNNLSFRSNVYGTSTLTAEELKAGANKLGEWFLNGMGAVGRFLNAGFTSPTYGTIGQVSHARNAEDARRQRELLESSEQALGKAMTWVSPLNYGAALATGNGLNARKGEEEVASWSPAWQAVGRLGELYVGPKAVKGIKNAPRTVINTAAKAGSKTAKKAVVAREINKATKNGIQEINLTPKILLYDTESNNYGFPKTFKDIGAESELRAFLGDDGYVYKIPKYGESDGTFVTKNMSINLLPNGLGAKTEFIGIRKNPDGTKTPIIRLEYVDPIKSRLLYLDLMKDYNYNDEFHYILFDNEGLHAVDDIRPSNVGTINGKLKIFDIGTYETPKNIQGSVIRTTRQEPSISLKFFERKPSKLNWSEKVGLPKEVRNRKVSQYTLEDARQEALLFAKKWGYELPENASLLLIEELYNLHNTFFRGVTTEHFNNSKNRIAKELNINPENLTKKLYLLYVSTHSWPGNDRIWVTPMSHYGEMYGNENMFRLEGLLSAVMRPWKTTKNIKQWPKEAEWQLGFKEDINEPVLVPWVSKHPNAIRSTGALTEFLIKGPLIYRGLGKNFKGTLLQQLKYNDGQGKLGWIESLVGELPTEIYIEKQGGKMNIIEFLKNGSGIHIKEKNKGLFTKYCNGKVTSECIAKGKKSPNPAIRKRATFADNARHFKHRSGGILRFLQQGGGINWGDFLLQGLTTTGDIISKYHLLKSDTELQIALNQLSYEDFYKNMVKEYLNKKKEKLLLWALDYKSGKTTDNPSNIVIENLLYLLTMNTLADFKNDIDKKNKLIELLNLQKINNYIAQAGIGLAQNFFSNIQSKNGAPSAA